MPKANDEIEEKEDEISKEIADIMKGNTINESAGSDLGLEDAGVALETAEELGIGEPDDDDDAAETAEEVGT